MESAYQQSPRLSNAPPRRCLCCGEVRPADAFDRKFKRNGESDGLHRRCRDCRRARVAARQCVDLPGEAWLPVHGYGEIYADLYEVSNLGRLRRQGLMLRIYPNADGYWLAYLSRGRAHRLVITLHILVARAFIGPCPEGQQVNHKDLDRQNCRADNLEYMTRSENVLHSYVCGTRPRKLTAEIARRILASPVSAAEIARQLGVSDTTVRAVRQGRTWRHVR